MSDTLDRERGDDAPPTAAKSSTGIDQERGATPEAKGNQFAVGTVTINKPRADLYAYFRDFSNLGTFMENVDRVEVRDKALSHWVVKAPAGQTVEWDARVTEERDGELIAWTSEEGADVANSGRVEFKDAGARGTVVTATILYDPPGGVVGKLIAKIFQREPAIQARRDLRRFKQLMETGEIATARMNPAQIEEYGR
jgi:uncharacterized membrane protein